MRVLEWRARHVCSQCGGREVGMVVKRRDSGKSASVRRQDG
jgi:hypothetical protein